MQRTFLLLAMVAGSSCISGSMMPRPSYATVRPESGDGVIFAGSQQGLAAAAISAGILDSYYDLAAEALGYSRNEYPEIWIINDQEWQGATFDDHIVFDPDDGVLEFAPLILTHEFVHWHAHGTALQRNLPFTVMEGLCEWIAADLTATWRDSRKEQLSKMLFDAQERGEFLDIVSRAGFGHAEFQDLTGRDRYEMYAIGFFLVDRIGVEALRSAAERGKVSIEAVLQMAATGVHTEGFREWPQLPSLNE